MLISQREVEIEWGDCDPAEIVFFPRYFAWFDASTAHHFKAAGLEKQTLRSRFGVVGFPVVKTGANFHVPSRFGDVVTIETRFVRFGRSSFDVEHRLLRGEQLAVEGFEKRVLVRKTDDGDGLTSCPIPAEVIELFGVDVPSFFGLTTVALGVAILVIIWLFTRMDERLVW